MRTRKPYFFYLFANTSGYYWVINISFLLFINFLRAEPIYRFNTNADAFLRIAFPTPRIQVDITRSFLERTNHFLPTSFGDVLNKNNTWSDVMDLNGQFQISSDGIESYWLSLLGRYGNLASLISSQLLSENNTSNIRRVCSNLISENMAFSSVCEKALFQRDVLQLYYIFINCTNYSKSPIEGSAINCRDLTVTVLDRLLQRLRLTEMEYQELTNKFTQATMQHHFEEKNPFELSRNFLPLRQALDGHDWYEMRFPANDNRHFNHYGGRSFVRVFAKTPGLSKDQFYSYWDEVNQKFGYGVHLNPDVPPLPAGTQLMLVRTFAVLLEDGTIADSGIPEEVLIRAFKTSESGLDQKSSDYRGTYFYQYKLNRRLLLQDPPSLGLVRHLDDDPMFYGFYSEVPDLNTALDAGIVTMRDNCIECHALLHYGSSTVFSLERPRLKDPKVDQFSGDLLQLVAGKNSRYTFGRINENIELDK
jgi:hypothetical protein